MARRIILLFDGTWNNRQDRTNVIRIKECIKSTGENDPDQPCFYDEGVGNHWYDKLTGGAFGRGLSENIRQGYQWLSERYEGGDEIFVFGFSRGAYTARSMVGLIRKCGLLKSPTRKMVREAYGLYRNQKIKPRDAEARAFRAAFSREVRIKFIGVWDTVGSLGIPMSHVPFNRSYYRWHDTTLSRIIDHAYHAIAIDEHRKDYDVAVWTAKKPENTVEQRWFIGAHANVGGGYGDDDKLPNIPLKWLQDKAKSCGLEFSKTVEVGSDDYLGEPEDTYKYFMFRAYKLFVKKHVRKFGTGVAETVDESVWRRWKADMGYRPASLLEHPDSPED